MCEREIVDFVTLHADRPRQRSKEWVAKRPSSIGGSEVAALMGWNPYSSFEKILAAKAGVSPAFVAGPACQWGTLFESVIERIVAIDCGARIYGTDINIPAPPGSGLEGLHTNSPDGYSCLTFYHNEAKEWGILKTDPSAQACAETRPQKRMVVLWEFKCPLSRRPRGEIPKQYMPQVWSGLALSPIAQMGVFVDTVFRKCAFRDLGPSPDFDQEYHRPAAWNAPIAWGLVLVYAPLGADGTSMSSEAQDLLYRELGETSTPEGTDLIDFGESRADVFEDMLAHLDRGLFCAIHEGPLFADGRGKQSDFAACLRSPPPARHFLLGVLPWKTFEVRYSLLEPRPGFLAEIAPPIRECLTHAARIRAAENPTHAYFSFCAVRSAQKKISRPRFTPFPPELFLPQNQEYRQTLRFGTDLFGAADPAGAG